MAFYKGNTPLIQQPKYGSSNAGRIYLGSTKIYGADPTDADATAFINAAGITDATQQSAIITLVETMKTDNLWDKMFAVYPFVGGTATSHKYNLVNPADTDAAFRMGFSGTWTHNADGVTGNGSNTYGRTYFVPSDQDALQENLGTSFSAGFYNKSNTTSGAPDFGAADGGAGTSPSNTMLIGRTNNQSLSDHPTPSYRVAYTAAQDWRGLWSMSRIAANDHRIFKNGSSLAQNTSSAPTTTFPSIDITLGSQQRPTLSFPDGYSSRNFAFFYLSSGLTTSEMSDFYDAIQAFQTTLGREE